MSDKQVWTETDKFRYFQFVIYEESAPKDFEQIMRDSKFEFAVSPWHTQFDSNEENECKPHKHVIFHTAGNSPWMVKRASKILNKLELPANGYIEPCFHPRNCQRYLIHMDNPEKQQFENGWNEIQIYNGFPLDLTRELSTEEKRIVRKKIFELIREYTILEYCDLLDALYDGYGDFDMIDYACNHTIMFNAYLTSRRNKFKDEGKND